jgi:tetratricopeptide (TPR) repeat protein
LKGISLINIAIFSCFSLGAAWAFGQESVTIETKSLKDATHIEISGRDDWRYELHRSAGQVVIQFSGLKSSDLEKLKSLSDNRVAKVKVEAGLNDDAKVTFALKSKNLNLFDYQTEKPTHLVFDIFSENKATGPLAKKTGNAVSKKVAKVDQFESKRKGRNVASVAEGPDLGAQPLLESSSDAEKRLEIKYGIFDGGDQTMSRFKLSPNEVSPSAEESAMIKSTQNIYIHFPALDLGHGYLSTLLSAEDPSRFDIPKDETDERMQVSLMVKLFSEQKYAVVLRTLKFFQEKYPVTKYQKQLDFLIAETYFKLWQRDGAKTNFDTAMTRFKELLNKYPDDQSRFRIILVIGVNYLEQGNFFGALSTFQVGTERYKDSPFYWQMRLATAEVLSQLNKDTAALAELDAIEKDPKASFFSAQARFRRGDVYFHKKDYRSAIKEYKEALTKFSEHAGTAPNLLFNTAESQFWLKDYKGALETYRQFLQQFPSHNFGGYAMTRIGEIFEILGASDQKSLGAYLESYYRFRGSPGASIAKFYVNMRKFSAMKEKERESVLSETEEDMSQIKSDDVNPFTTLSLARAYLTHKDYSVAQDLVVKFYQKNVLSPYLPIFKNQIEQNLTTEMKNQNSADSLKCIETYLKNKDSWFKNSKRVDTAFILGQAYESLSLNDDAENSYEFALKNYLNLSSEGLKEAKVFESLPTADELSLRLAASNMKSDNLKKATTHIAEIKNVNSLSESERVERSLIVSNLAEKEEHPDLALLALNDLTDHWKGKPDLLADAWLKLAHIQISQEKYAEALPWVNKVIAASEKNPDKIKAETVKQAFELAGDIHTKLKQAPQAINSYKTYLNKYGQTGEASPIKYKLGKVYFDSGDLRQAKLAWDDLKNDENGKLWAKMANENMAQANWTSKYGRYLREPASTGGAQ